MCRRLSTCPLAERHLVNPRSFRKAWKLMTGWRIGMIQPRDSGIETSGNVWLRSRGSKQKEVRRPESSKERSASLSPARTVNSPQTAPGAFLLMAVNRRLLKERLNLNPGLKQKTKSAKQSHLKLL